MSITSSATASRASRGAWAASMRERALPALAVARHQPPELVFLGAVDDQDAVHDALEVGSRRAAESRGPDRARPPTATGVRARRGSRDAGSLRALRRVASSAKIRCAQRRAIQRAVAVEDAAAEAPATSAASAGLPGATTSRASWSVSSTATPSAANRLATVRLAAGDAAGEPDAQASRGSAEAREARDSGPRSLRRPTSARSSRRRRGTGRTGSACPRPWRRAARCSAMPTTAPTTAASRMTSSSICQPSQAPSAAKQLEVAVAHAFLAGDQLEELVHAPEAQVARDRADDAVAQGRPAARRRPPGCQRLASSSRARAAAGSGCRAGAGVSKSITVSAIRQAR